MRIKRFCPICKKPVAYERGQEIPPHFPFCGERCKLIDLGKWIDEDYRVSETLRSDDRSERGKDDAGDGDSDSVS
jgi:hypothetical protein